MNKILLLASGILFFGCETTTRTSENASATTNENAATEESVEKGSGTEISPQLEGVEDSASRLQVDPVTSSSETK